jgi:tetratricopeptide (TPR) repeat protein
MSIDQLADQIEQAMSLAQQTPSDGTGPALPPQLAVGRGKSVEEVLADLNKSPLFMTEMEENDDIAALQALAYEGTPLENAADFKERGNECFKVKGYKDAQEFYGKGIAILFIEERKRTRGEITKNSETGEPDSEEEIKQQREMLEAMYVNRAACHLGMENYRSCWTDCAAALRLNPRNVKAYYRSGRALLAVDRIAEADDVCSRGLALEPENKSLRSVADGIVKRATTLDELRRKAAEREAKKQRRALLLKAALMARGIKMRQTAQPPEMEDAKVTLLPNEDDPSSELAFPTVLLYPLHLESDFIKAFQETHTLEDHLGYIFPLPWDREKSYTLAGVTCYVETKEGGLIKMGKKVPLLKVLSGGKVEVVDEVVRIFVLPTAKAEGWVKEFKEKRAAERGERS